MLEELQKRYFIMEADRTVLTKFIFTSEESANKMLPVLKRAFNLKNPEIIDMYVLPETKVDLFVERYTTYADHKEQEADVEAQQEKERKVYLRDHKDEYWNTSEETFKKKPTPVWSTITKDGGWWRHVSPEMYQKDTDYYQEFFEETGVIMSQKLAMKAPNLLGKHLEETVRCTVYEKALLEGRCVNINSAGGFNSCVPDMVRVSEREPVSETQDGGLNGILTPDGVWYPCNHEGHSDLVRWLEDNTSYKVDEAYYKASDEAEGAMFVFFSHGYGLMFGLTSVAYTHGTYLSTEAIDWLTDQLDVMSNDQRYSIESTMERDKRKKETV